MSLYIKFPMPIRKQVLRTMCQMGLLKNKHTRPNSYEIINHSKSDKVDQYILVKMIESGELKRMAGERRSGWDEGE